MTTPSDRERRKKTEIKGFRALFLPLIQEHTAKLNYKVTGMMAVRGDLYGHELMVVGRALNGGHSVITPSKDACHQSRLDRFVSKTVEDCTTVGCPQRWVERGRYRTNRSAFWLTNRDVTRGLEIAVDDDEEWSSRLVWSNLYKLAPMDGGNPVRSLQTIQQSACIKMLALELATYKPQRVLFLTGNGWFLPFRGAVGVSQTSRLSKALKHVHEVGNATLPCGHQYQYVVAPHPQGKKRHEIVGEILHGFSRL